MRKAVFLSLLIAVVCAGSAFAQYNCSSAPQYVAFGYGYWDYTHNPLTSSSQQCWTFSDTTLTYLQNCTLSNCGKTGWCARAMYQTISQTVTVGANDYGTSTWEFFYSYDLYGSNLGWWDQVGVLVTVTHNGQGTNYSFTKNGSQGTSNCASEDLIFSAVNGDTITVTFHLDRGDPANTVAISDAHLWRRNY